MSKVYELTEIQEEEIEEIFYTCSICGSENIEEDCNFHGDQIICHECLQNQNIVICYHCDIRLRNEDNYGTENLILCRSCRETYYTKCELCQAPIENSYIHSDPETSQELCLECFNKRLEEKKLIHQYSYKPGPIFYGEKTEETIWLGMELEIDTNKEQDIYEVAENFLSVANSKNKIMYFKRDSSLSQEGGLELVFHPASLEYIQKSFPLKNILSCAINHGYLSHQMLCGCHVHVGKAELGVDDADIEKTISNIMFFVNKNWDQVVKFSRRTKSQITKWCNKYPSKDSPKELIDTVKESINHRYTCINQTPETTLEFRVFRGSLRFDTILATLQFVDEVCRVSKRLSQDEMIDFSWQHFVEGIGNDKCQLIHYLR